MDKYFRNVGVYLLFILPGLILFTLFVTYPILPLLITSFQKHDGIAPFGFVGLRNYFEIFQNSTFWKANLNNLYIMILLVLINFPVSIAVAFYFAYGKFPFKKVLRAIYFLPVVISTIVICQLWIAIYQPNWGLLNKLLQLAGMDWLQPVWLGTKATVIPSIVMAILWQWTGFNIVIFYAGIKNIPEQYFEAAKIDGASMAQIMTVIIVPLLREVIKFLLITTTLSALRVFAHVQLMTRGGPGDASYTMVFMLYEYSFARNRFGMGSAMAVVYILEGLIVTLLINSLVGREKIEY